MHPVSDDVTYLEQHYRWLATWARPTTVRDRQRSLSRFMRAAGTHPLAATRDEVEVWFASMTTTAATRTNELAHLAAFYRWASVHELRTDDPTCRIRRPKVRQYVPRPVALEQVRDAIAAAPGRLRPMILLMVGCGLRACEVAGLSASDVHRGPDGAGRIFVRDGKGGKQRWVDAPAPVIDSLTGLPRRGHLFVRQDGGSGPLTPHRVSCLVNRYLHSVGVEETAHALRHTYATVLYDESKDLLLVQTALGHGSVQTTTQVYVKVPTQDTARAAAAVMTRVLG